MTNKEKLLVKILLVVVLAAVFTVSGTEGYRRYKNRLESLKEMVSQTAALEAAAVEVPALEQRRAVLEKAIDGSTVTSIGSEMDIVGAGRAIGRIAGASGASIQRLSPEDSRLTVSTNGTVKSLLQVLERLYIEQPELYVEMATLDSYNRPGKAEMTVVVRYENNAEE